MRHSLCRRAVWLVMLAVLLLALAGCSSGNTVNQAIGAASHAAQDLTRLSEKTMRSWCPKAVANGGGRLTRAQARGCLQRAWNWWQAELRRNGYNPHQVVNER